MCAAHRANASLLRKNISLLPAIGATGLVIYILRPQQLSGLLNDG